LTVDLTLIRGQFPRDHLEKRGFSSAVATEQANPLTHIDLQIDSVEEQRASKRETEIK